ncbi:MAG: ABC transporter permease [Acidimicrobiia bacterium]|nr:ABC transporter permease [Acidimicrobiia bacterium]MDH4307153.1 ABC transporter permease [Acidimicrobiia bacterium]MDH5292305.1 ABC transporter permease [Acidimicrobiia bacterium]
MSLAGRLEGEEAKASSPSSRLGKTVTLGPGLAYLAVMLGAPLALIVGYSFLTRGSFGGVVMEPTLDAWGKLANPIFFDVVAGSIKIASIATVLALAIGYPAAWVIAGLPAKWKTVALVAVVLPFWSNFLIRTYAWIVLLNNEGLINRVLRGWGLIDEPLGMLYTEGAIVVGLVYIYLPLMILPLYSSIERLDPALREAAFDLGASPRRTFRRVLLPLTLPGIMAGSIFVFVPSLGNFVVPELLGGGQEIMIGNLVRDQFFKARDLPFGSVLALCVIALMLVLLFIQATVLRRTRETHG